MPTLDQNFIVDGLNTTTVTVTRRGIGGPLEGFLSIRFGTVSTALMYKVTVDNFFGNVWNNVGTGYVNHSTTPINIAIRGFFNDVRVTLVKYGDAIVIPSSTIVLFYRMSPGDVYPADTYYLPGFFGGTNLDVQQELYGAHIVDSGILERPRKTILRASSGNMYVFGSTDTGTAYSVQQTSPVIIMPRMVAGVRPSDTIIVTLVLSCTPVTQAGQSTATDGFAIDAYGFNATHIDGYSPWRIGKARKMFRSIWDSPGPYTLNNQAVSINFYGNAISYNTGLATLGTYIDPLIEAQKTFMASPTRAVYFGTNGYQAIMTEVSSFKIVGVSGVPTMTVSGTTATLSSSTLGDVVEPTRALAYGTTNGALGGNPPVDAETGRATYKAQMVIKGSNMSFFVESGQSGMVYAGSAYGEFDALSVPAVTLFGANGVAVSMTLLDFNVGVVESNDVAIGAGNLSGGSTFGRATNMTTTNALIVTGETPKNVVSIFGKKSTTLPCTLKGVNVSGRHINDGVSIVALGNTRSASLFTVGSTPVVLDSTVATTTDSRDVPNMPFVLSPYVPYGVAVDNVAIGTYTCSYDVGY